MFGHLKKTLFIAFRATLIFLNTKTFQRAVFNYKPLKLQLRVFLAGHTVAMVTYCVTKMTTTCSPMIGHIFDTMIVASSDNEWLKPPIKIEMLETA